MIKRNEFLEIDGLCWESETHEWFYDKLSTAYARGNTITLDAQVHQDGLDVVSFITRSKVTGEYDRVLMDKPSNQIIYSSKDLEALGVHIDMLKTAKRFGV